jgi:hypothetical protein
MRLLVLAFVVACGGHHFNPTEGSEIGGSAVAVGAHVPDVTMTTASGNHVALISALAAHDKTVVVFYRGFY